MLNIGPRNRTGPQGPIGLPGGDGATWHFGLGEPGNGLGKVGDFFLNGNTFDIFIRVESGWEFVGNLKGPRGPKGVKGEQGEKGEPGLNGRVWTRGSGGGDVTKGTIKTLFGEISTNPGATQTVVTYTVPIGKAFELLKVLISGPNVADYFVKEDGATIATSGTDYLEFDDTIPFDRRRFEAGQVVSVDVKNLGASKETFNATIVGDLFGVL